MTCPGCGIAEGTFRCPQCFDTRLLCQECLVERHVVNPFHIVEVSANSTYMATMLTVNSGGTGFSSSAKLSEHLGFVYSSTISTGIPALERIQPSTKLLWSSRHTEYSPSTLISAIVPKACRKAPSFYVHGCFLRQQSNREPLLRLRSCDCSSF